MKKVLVIGSINVDLVVNVDNLPIKGQTIAGSAFNQYFGGKGANQAYAIAKFGSQTKMIGQVGNDSYGQQAIDNLQAIDSTAAGDTFIGGFVSQIAAGKDKKEALAFATKASAIAVTRFGAQPSIPTITEVLEWN